MRVALYHNLPPGGALHVVRDFVSGVPTDVTVDVFTLDTGEASPFPRRHRLVGHGREIAIPLHPGPLVQLSLPVLAAQLPRAEQRIAREIDERGYDVAYIHPCWISYAPSLARYLRTPSLLYLHEVRRATFEPSYRQGPSGLLRVPGWTIGRATDSLLARWDKRSVAAAHHLACNSIYTAERILGSYGRTAEVVQPGYDEEVFRPIEHEAVSPSLALSVGGLEPHKNHRVIVEALGLLPREIRPRLGLVYDRCDHRYRTEVLTAAERLGVKIEEYRSLAYGALAALYSKASVTVLAGQLEPLGLVPLESIGCGTPVVAVREAGYRETVTDGVNGLLVPRSVRELSRAVESVLRENAGLVSNEELPMTILPKWSSGAAIRRQLDTLERISYG